MTHRDNCAPTDVRPSASWRRAVPGAVARCHAQSWSRWCCSTASRPRPRLILGGFGLGVAFLKAEFSYTASWRRFLTRGEAGGLLGGLIVIAVAALVIVPVAALVPDFGGAIAPLGPSLMIGAFVFGIGMQLANGCGSGTLYTAGGGSGRMLIALAFFIVGSVLGSLSLPPLLALGGIDPVLASDYFGPWGGLAVDAGEHRAGGRDHRGGRETSAARTSCRRAIIVIGGLIIGLLCIGVFVAGGHPVERDLRLHGLGRQDRVRAAASISRTAEFWQWAGPQARAGRIRCCPTPRA